ncbi:hypothetical protein C8J25_10798 [Sphingomonas faeni]|uniref:Uncharacterized protein n=1 Tax=Sphingomonas faeni TaxID=185950 RepID=A0A2T5U1R8_9SPHN|nr:hypothetical protein C8J25_10798 [Sphingomonas faeni]
MCFPAKAGIQTGLPPSRENKKRSGLGYYRPGEGRGPIGKAGVTKRRT